MYKIYYNYNDMITELTRIKSCDYRYLYDLLNSVIASYGNKIRTYILEEYIESEWRDIYGIYYGKQRESISNKTIRLHIISSKISNLENINQKNYYGYLTLRPICNNALTVSRIRIKYDKEYYKAKNLFVFNQQSIVSFPHIKIKYYSFPFFRQDGMVTVCAHADIHMLIKTMHQVHGFNKYGITNILNQINSIIGRDIPNEGLSMDDMVSALKIRNFNPMVTKFTNGEYLLESGYAEYNIFEFLDCMIESQLPSILAFDGHVVIVVGGSRDEDGDFDKYLIYDDSGYHINKLELRDKYPNHTRLIKKSELSLLIVENKQFKNCMVIVPTFKSLYYRYKHLHKQMEGVIKIFDAEDRLNYRLLLVNSKEIKIHLNKENIPGYNNVLLPHYIWFIELYSSEEIEKICIVDAMAHQYTNGLPIIKDIDGEDFLSVQGIKRLILLKEIK